LRMRGLFNSEAHTTEQLGTYYPVRDECPAHDQELSARLKAGRFRCVQNGVKAYV